MESLQISASFQSFRMSWITNRSSLPSWLEVVEKAVVVVIVMALTIATIVLHHLMFLIMKMYQMDTNVFADTMLLRSSIRNIVAAESV